MAAKSKKSEPVGTVAARHAREAEREAAAREERARLVAEERKRQAELEKFHAKKPADSRDLER
jgi:hypothetical protein